MTIFFFKEVIYKNILNIENLHIKKHAITCIVGESGSGKTTLLRLLNRLTSYDSGTIFYHKQPLSDIDPTELRREVVMLPQAPAIFAGSIKDNLLIGLRFSEKPLIPDHQLYDVLNLVKLHKDLDQDAAKLSGGEKQRVALGRVILMKPEVLLLDEPSSALDETTEHIIINALVNYTKENNKTLIMVTHSKQMAKEFADDIIIMNKGMIINERWDKEWKV